MSGNDNSIDDKLKNDQPLFEYVRPKRVRRWPLWLKILTIYTILAAYVTLSNLASHGQFTQACLVAIVWQSIVGTLAAWGIMALVVRIKRPPPVPPVAVGGILDQLLVSHQQGKVSVAGRLFLGEKGIGFVPDSFGQLVVPFDKCKALEASWDRVGKAYRSTGNLAPSELLTGGLRDRLGLEVDGVDHFFALNAAYDLESVITTLEKTRRAALGFR